MMPRVNGTLPGSRQDRSEWPNAQSISGGLILHNEHSEDLGRGPFCNGKQARMGRSFVWTRPIILTGVFSPCREA